MVLARRTSNGPNGWTPDTTPQEAQNDRPLRPSFVAHAEPAGICAPAIRAGYARPIANKSGPKLYGILGSIIQALLALTPERQGYVTDCRIAGPSGARGAGVSGATTHGAELSPDPRLR